MICAFVTGVQTGALPICGAPIGAATRALRGGLLMGYLGGFKVSFGKLLKGSRSGRSVTNEYAEDSGPKKPKADRLHGRHVLNRYEDGMEKCIGCELDRKSTRLNSSH